MILLGYQSTLDQLSQLVYLLKKQSCNENNENVESLPNCI